MIRQRRTATKESRVSEFSKSVSHANPQHGAEFARLTEQGKGLYVELRDDGYDHTTAYNTAHYNHGETRA